MSLGTVISWDTFYVTGIMCHLSADLSVVQFKFIAWTGRRRLKNWRLGLNSALWGFYTASSLCHCFCQSGSRASVADTHFRLLSTHNAGVDWSNDLISFNQVKNWIAYFSLEIFSATVTWLHIFKLIFLFVQWTIFLNYFWRFLFSCKAMFYQRIKHRKCN